MNTAARATALAEAARHFPILGPVSAEDLLECVRLELGHAEVLDGFRPYGAHFSKAFPPQGILHIISGNTAHAGLQSLLRGLLLGSSNLVKLPSAGLPEVQSFVERLPEELQKLVTVKTELPDAWLRTAKAWVVFGSDETIAYFRKQAAPQVIFEAHPHRISLGLVFDDPGFHSAPLAARDVSQFNQKGCLSAQNIYVAGDARLYAMRLAEEMARYEQNDPRSLISTAEAAEIADVRANYRFRAASDIRVQLWESPGSTAWTVIYEEESWFAASCLNRVVFVKPLPDRPSETIGPALSWLAAVGIWPATPENAEKAALLGPSRICPLGQMQLPAVTWHQEGRQILAPMVRWVDFDANIS